MFKTMSISGASAILALTMGCITPSTEENPFPRPPAREIPSFLSSEKGTNQPLHQEPTAIENVKNLTLRQALVLALLSNPELEVFAHDVRAAEARLLQAGLLPNPEIEFELESYDRDGAGYDSSEPSIVLGQVIELGRKRHWRVQLASASGDLAAWNYESKRLDVFSATAQRFTDVIAAQQRLELAKELMTLAEKTGRTVSERVSAGKESPVQKTKAAAELEMARLETTTAENSLLSARCALASMWGSIEPEFQQAVGDFDTILELPPALELLQLQIASNPDLARGQSEILMQQAALDSALAERYPDLKVAAGVKRFEEDETHALIFGFGVPLPLFNRNQGNISAARDELAKAQAMERATAIRLASELAATHARLTSAHSRVRTLSTKVIPALEESYAATHQGYQQGKYGILEVLDAQRHLFTTKNELIDALAVYHTALTDIERLTGMKTEYQDFKM